jgi:hypothetical protein
MKPTTLLSLSTVAILAVGGAAVVLRSADGDPPVGAGPSAAARANPPVSSSPASEGPPEETRYVAWMRVVSPNDYPTYRVRPTRAGRIAGAQELAGPAWRQAVAAGVPDTPGMRQQFLCHPYSIIGRAKPTWDLEPWRPTVGMTRTILAACNP